jgi:hypothetical protein
MLGNIVSYIHRKLLTIKPIFSHISEKNQKIKKVKKQFVPKQVNINSVQFS